MQLLITGASGQLGGYLLREARQMEMQVIAWSGRRQGELFGVPLTPVDLTSANQVEAAFHAARPDAVLHAAALSSVADCYRQPDLARRINTEGTRLLAKLAAAAAIRLVYVSTDLVFDGVKGGYTEADVPVPLSIYGRSKRDGELAVLAFPTHLVTRVSLLFGPSVIGRQSFFDQQLAALRERRSFALFNDEYRTPISYAVAARALLELAGADVTGVLHMGGPERLSRWEMGQRLAATTGADPSLFTPTTRASIPAQEPRPRDVSLNSRRWRQRFPLQPWPEFADALRELKPI